MICAAGGWKPSGYITIWKPLGAILQFKDGYVGLRRLGFETPG
jgi:hypothetical protein